MSEGKNISLVNVNAEALSKPVVKLIETVSACIGTLYEPKRIRRKAKADADALVIATRADIKRQELLQRAAERIVLQEGRRQENIEDIVSQSIRVMPDQASDDPVDPDWIIRFFESCQDVSPEQLQHIWAKVLANEVADPGSCARKTLSVLKELGVADAEGFRNLCSLVWHDDDRAFVPLRKPFGYPLGEFGITFRDCMNLVEVGLIHTESTISLTFMEEGWLAYHDRTHTWQLTTENIISVPMLPLTRPGYELLKVCNAEPSDDYYAASVSLLAHEFRLPLASPWKPTEDH